jgi:hypothetical protein
MTSRRDGEPRTRRHIWIDDDDWQWITSRWGSRDSIGVSKAIRLIIKTFRRNAEAAAGASAKRPQVDISAEVDAAVAAREAQELP